MLKKDRIYSVFVTLSLLIKLRMRWAVYVAPMVVRRNVFRILIWKLKGKGAISWEIVHRWKGDTKHISNIMARN
jgi:hypothetical protein